MMDWTRVDVGRGIRGSPKRVVMREPRNRQTQGCGRAAGRRRNKLAAEAVRVMGDSGQSGGLKGD